MTIIFLTIKARLSLKASPALLRGPPNKPWNKPYTISLTWSDCLEMKGMWEGKEDKEAKEQSTKVTLSSLGLCSEHFNAKNVYVWEIIGRSLKNGVKITERDMFIFGNLLRRQVHCSGQKVDMAVEGNLVLKKPF